MASSQRIILMTGSSGRLGSRIAKAFSKEFHVIGLDVVPPKDLGPNETFYQMDIGKDLSVNETMQQILETHGSLIASVIHLAAYYSFDKQDWELYQNITIDGTKRFLNGLKSFKVEQFIFSSTQLVYAPCSLGEKINENSPVEPKWEYPNSKVMTEQEILKNHEDTTICIMRISGIYDDVCHSVPLSHQIQRIYENSLEKYFFSGNLNHGAPFLHMSDFIDSLYKTVNKRSELPKKLVLLLGESKTYSYDQIQRHLGKLIDGKEFRTYRIPKFLAKFGAFIQNHLPFYPKPFIKPWMIDISDDHYELDISFSKKMIDWEPKHHLVDTLPKMVESLNKDPKAWYKEHGLT